MKCQKSSYTKLLWISLQVETEELQKGPFAWVLRRKSNGGQFLKVETRLTRENSVKEICVIQFSEKCIEDLWNDEIFQLIESIRCEHQVRLLFQEWSLYQNFPKIDPDSRTGNELYGNLEVGTYSFSIFKGENYFATLSLKKLIETSRQDMEPTGWRKEGHDQSMINFKEIDWIKSHLIRKMHYKVNE